VILLIFECNTVIKIKHVEQQYNYLTRSATCTVSWLLYNLVWFRKFSHKSALDANSTTIGLSVCTVCQSGFKLPLVSYHCQIATLHLQRIAWVWRKWSLDICDYIHSNSRLHFISEDISLAVSLLLSSWTCSSSLYVITVSTVQFQTVKFIQYLYSKCAVLLCSWTCSSSFCVISVSTVQLHTVQVVQYLYSKFAVLLCSWTRNFCVITVSTVRLHTVH
jgi:hypothetical protein